jgi:membrane-associated protease RseP (regulator of RpoE activity)
MPNSPLNSSDSPKPSVAPSASAPSSFSWRLNLGLFLATVVSVFVTVMLGSPEPPFSRAALVEGAEFTGALLSILLVHEFGHYIAARLHKVDATLPFFIPMPILSPWGTMGAVIRMRSVIPTRKALLDIGASGPLAGLVLAIPMYAWGVAHSKVVPLDGGGVQLGSSIAARLIERWFAPAVPEGMDLLLSPVAWAAWAGMFVTMINLLPAGQLDAGHVAYALLGPRQNKIARIVHRGVLAFFFVSFASFMVRDVRAGLGFSRVGERVMSSMFWFVWFEVLAVLGTVSSSRPKQIELGDETPKPPSIGVRLVGTLGLAMLAGLLREYGRPWHFIPWFVAMGMLLAMEARGGALSQPNLLDHPATGPAPLGAVRTVIAVVTLLFFVLLFMPTPIAM